jgi:hypothetical protein
MSSWAEPVDLRVTDPRATALAAAQVETARAVVLEHLGDDSTGVLHALGIEVAA